jgi:hypothetical protein
MESGLLNEEVAINTGDDIGVVDPEWQSRKHSRRSFHDMNCPSTFSCRAKPSYPASALVLMAPVQPNEATRDLLAVRVVCRGP